MTNMLKILSRLPERVLYGFAGFLFFLAYYVVRHRARVIREQLRLVFPHKSGDEIAALHKKFLRGFCDVFVEILRGMTISADDMRERVRIRNIEAAKAYLDRGQSVMLVTAHLNNWEWLLQGVTVHLGYPVDAAYKPLHDEWAEKLMRGIRERFGARLIPAKQLLADYLRHRGAVRALAMNADQAPVSSEVRYWTTFLNQDTAFYLGAEQISRAVRLPVIYLAMRRIKRGYYEVELKEIWDGKERLEPTQITERYARLNEKEVLKQPADWLWSYRRWKLKRPLYGASVP